VTVPMPRQSKPVVLDDRPGGIATTVVQDELCPVPSTAVRELGQAIDGASEVERWTSGSPGASPTRSLGRHQSLVAIADAPTPR
jgi:hypothetical protein